MNLLAPGPRVRATRLGGGSALPHRLHAAHRHRLGLRRRGGHPARADVAQTRPPISGKDLHHRRAARQPRRDRAERREHGQQHAGDAADARPLPHRAADDERHRGAGTRPTAWATSPCPTAGPCRWRCSGTAARRCRRRGTPSTSPASACSWPPGPTASRCRRSCSRACPAPSRRALHAAQPRRQRHHRAEGRGWYFDYPVDPEMLAVARSLTPAARTRCGPKARRRRRGRRREASRVREQPRLKVGGRGVGHRFPRQRPVPRVPAPRAAGPDLRDGDRRARPRRPCERRAVPSASPALRSLSDLAGGEGFDADVGALLASGLAEANEAAVTAFLEAWRQRPAGTSRRPDGSNRPGTPR